MGDRKIMNESFLTVKENKGKVAVVITVLLFLFGRFLGEQLTSNTNSTISEVVLDTEDLAGCCYDVGYGTLNKECCLNIHPGGTSGTMKRSKCPVGKRMGGGTKFKEGLTCEKFEEEWNANAKN